MSCIGRPADGVGKTEKISLDSTARHILEECRMVLPGIQAVFGFQLIAVFNESFRSLLSGGEQLLHCVATLLMTLAVAFLMAPAALHRQTQQQEVSERFIWLSSRLVLLGMFPLVSGLCLDVYLVARIITDSVPAALLFALLAAGAFFALWVVLPRTEKRFHERQPPVLTAGNPD